MHLKEVMKLAKDWKWVNTPAGPTIRERRRDARQCTYCRQSRKVLWDYTDTYPFPIKTRRLPAFCSISHWIGFELKNRLRVGSSIEGAPPVSRRRPRRPATPSGTSRKTSTGKQLVAV